MTSTHTLRVPGFMAAVRATRAAVTAFTERKRGDTGAFATLAAVPEAAAALRADLEPAATAVPAPVIFAPVETPAVTVAALERQMAETASRVELAVERLRTASERLAAEARADALEIAMMVARRIIETELTTNVEAQVALIRTAVKRLGESRAIVVRMAPAQAASLLAHAAGDELAKNVSTTAHLEIVADATLERGDCVVEGELGSVDGRIGHRLEEIRRAVLGGLDGETA